MEASNGEIAETGDEKSRQAAAAGPAERAQPRKAVALLEMPIITPCRLGLGRSPPKASVAFAELII